MKNIFNADETGLFCFRSMPSRSMVQKGDACREEGTDHWITVLLCASATGEKLKPLVIGSQIISGVFAKEVWVLIMKPIKRPMTSKILSGFNRKQLFFSSEY